MFGLNIKNKFLDRTLVQVINGKATLDRNTLCNSTSSTKHCKCKRWPRKLFRSKIMFLSSMPEKSKSCSSLDSTAINLSVVLQRNIEYQKKNFQPLMTRKSILSLLWWTRKPLRYRVVQIQHFHPFVRAEGKIVLLNGHFDPQGEFLLQIIFY